ncbi:hypothetical protein LOAG_18037 [Loa loa]|nr:hypothetical protein LOAG_18037 [Loa loa]EJD74673.1 hypothetical protein LOAG_18037 [Loa loa]
MRCSDAEKAYQKLLSLKVMEDNYPNLSAENHLLKKSLSIDKYRCLPCDAECQRALRNEKMAEILNIPRPDAADDVAAYTIFLKNKLKTNYKEILDIEDTLLELVHGLNAQPNVTSVSHSFPPLHSELRRIIHEYSRYFGIETISHGQEPQRNVVATAKRNVSYMPAVFLTAFKRYAATSSVSASSNATITPSKILSSIPKSYLYAENRMQQLKPVGKVLKRGFKEPLASQK